MKDRIPGKPGQYKATVAAAETQRILTGEEFTITLKRDDQPVVPGTPYSKAAVLPDALAQKLCSDIADPTPADAFNALHKSVENVGSKSAAGSVITLSDAGDAPLHALKIYGKTLQNGTPTPDAPVPLESVGASGAIHTTVCGAQLIPTPKNRILNGITGTVADDGTITYSGTATGAYSHNLIDGLLPVGTYCMQWNKEGLAGFSANVYNYTTKQMLLNNKDGVFTVTNSTDNIMVYVNLVSSGATINGSIRPMLNFGDKPLPYEPYKEPQTLTASTPNGLPGIPVASGGNYTDENGQMWICDEIDFGRGMYVKRVYQHQFDGTQDVGCLEGGEMYTMLPYKARSNNSEVLCRSNYYPGKTRLETNKNGNTPGFMGISVGNEYARISDIDNFSGDTNAFKLWLAKKYADGNPLMLCYILAEPIETPIPEDELTAYRAMHTNDPNTAIYNDGGAYMEIGYYSPNSALPVELGSGRAGHLLSVDERGFVTTLPNPTVESKEYPGCFYRIIKGEKEWINPPMIPGVEYRTTEGWNAKAVFVKTVSAGALTNGAYVTFEEAIYTGGVRVAATVEGYVAPFYSGGALVFAASAEPAPNGVRVTLYSNNWFDGKEVTVCLWYTKD